MPNMYKRVGGGETVDRIIRDYHEALWQVPFFQAAFENQDMRALAERHRRFLTWVLDGPASLDQASRQQVEADLKMSESAFGEAMERLERILHAHLPAQSDVHHVMRAVFRREPLIVTRPGDGG